MRNKKKAAPAMADQHAEHRIVTGPNHDQQSPTAGQETERLWSPAIIPLPAPVSYTLGSLKNTFPHLGPQHADGRRLVEPRQ
jgi:hypothetical protein